MTQPTNNDFANEVRFERLTILWQVTLGLSLVALWGVISIGLLQKIDVLQTALIPVPIIAGAILTHLFLRLNQFNRAVWMYTIGTFAGISVALAGGDATIMQIAPYSFPLLLFVVGLLLPPSRTFMLAGLAVLVTFALPLLTTGSWAFVTLHQMAAVALTILSTLLAAQVTGELYRVTEWALHHYQRERRTSDELYKSREALEISLARSQSLSDRLQETNKALEDAKHFRGQFLANMSHELRTPLNAIIGFSETMLRYPAMYDDIELPEAYHDDLRQIHDSGRHLLSIINDILDLSKVDAGKLEIEVHPVELKPVFDHVTTIANGLIGNRPITLAADLPDPLPPVLADSTRLQQVLVNLYSNAVKYTERGQITLRVREKADGVQISVQDTGSGIASEHLDDIFEEFKQAGSGNRRDPRSGAGLGLAISRQLVTLMGGSIWAESVVNEGSTFHVLLHPYREAETVGQLTPLTAVPDREEIH